MEKLIDQGKIKLVLQDEQLKWIRADLSSEQSFNQKELKDPERPIEAISAEAKKIMSFITNLTDTFTIPDLKDQFPGLSTNQIYKALKELSSQGKIKLVLQDEQLKWVGVDLAPKKETSQKKPDNSRKSVQMMQTKMSRFHEGLRKAKEAVQTMGEEVSQLQKGSNDTRELTQATKTETKPLQEKLESIKRLLEVVEQERKQLQEGEESKIIKESLEVTEQETRQLQKELKSIKKSLEAIESSPNQSHKEEELKSIKKLLEITEREVHQLQEEIKNIKKLMQTTKRESDQIQKEIKNISELMQTAEQGIRQVQKEPKNIQESMEKIEEKTHQIQEKLQDTREGVTEIEREISQLQEKLNNTEKLAGLTEQETSPVQEGSKNIERLTETSKKETDQIQSKLKSIKRLLETAEQKSEQLQDKLQNTRTLMQTAEHKTSQVQEKLQSTRELIKEVEHQISQLQEGPQIIKKLLEAAIKRFNQLWEELKNPGSSIETVSAETEKIISFIKSLTSPFEVPNIEKKFPSLSTDQIYKTLMELTDQGQIKIILQDNRLKWIRADLSSEQGFTQKKPKDPQKPEEALSAEAEKILPFIDTLINPFDIPHIKNQFSGLSTNQIYKALMELTNQGKISLVLHNKQLKWVRADLLPEKGMIWEKISIDRAEAWLIANSNIIMPFIEGMEKAFALSDIKKQFPNLSSMVIENVLNKLISEGKIMLLQLGDENKSSLWIKIDTIHERGLTIKAAIDEYYGNSEKNLHSASQAPALQEDNLKTTNRSPSEPKPIPPENRGIAKALFDLANSFTPDFKLSEETKTAFREIIKIYTELNDAFTELIEERNIILGEGGDPMSFFAPRDALSMVWHTAGLTKTSGNRLLDPSIENSVQHITHLIYDIIDHGGRSSYAINKNLNAWFDHWQREVSIFEQESY